jgi:predicted RNA methylase
MDGFAVGQPRENSLSKAICPMTLATKIRELRVLRAKHASALMNPPFTCKLSKSAIMNPPFTCKLSKSAIMNPPFTCKLSKSAIMNPPFTCKLSTPLEI